MYYVSLYKIKYKKHSKVFFSGDRWNLDRSILLANPLYIDAKYYRPFPNSTFYETLNFLTSACSITVLPEGRRGMELLQLGGASLSQLVSLALPALHPLGKVWKI